jgi:hypothetical protein
VGQDDTNVAATRDHTTAYLNEVWTAFKLHIGQGVEENQI